jgi:hypothetical protein
MSCFNVMCCAGSTEDVDCCSLEYVPCERAPAQRQVMMLRSLICTVSVSSMN